MKLLINGNKVDTKGNINVLLQRRLLTGDDITKRGGDFSASFTLPITNVNKKIFGFVNDLQTVNKFYTGQKFDAELSEDEIPLISGTLRFRSPAINLATVEYTVNINSNNIDWVNLIGEKKLNELDLGRFQFSAQNTLQNIVQYTANTATHYANNYLVYPLIAYGQYFMPTVSTIASIIDVTTGYSESIDSLPQLSFVDIPPSFYLGRVVEKIFSEIGFKIQGSFINSQEYKNLVLPYCNELDLTTVLNYAVDIDYFKDYNGNVNNSVLDAGSNLIQLDEATGSTLSVLITTDGNYNFNLTASEKVFLIFAYYNTNNSIQIRVNNNLVLSNTSRTLDVNYSQYLNAGDTVQIKIIWENIYIGSQRKRNYTLVSNNSGQSLSGNLASYLPDLKQLDLIQFLIKYFNLYFEVDVVNRVVYLQKREDYFQPSEFAADITKYVDASTYVLDQNSIAEQYNFSWAEDDSDYLTSVNTLPSFVYTPVNPNTSRQEVTLPVAYTFTTPFYPAVNSGTYGSPVFNLSGVTSIQIPVIADVERFTSVQSGTDYLTWDFDYTPRILSLNGSHSIPLGLPFRSGSTIVRLTTIPKAVPVANWATNFITQYEVQFRELQQSHTVTVNAYLPYSTWVNLPSNKLVIIDGIFYTVLEIKNYSTVNGSCTLLLQRSV